MARPCCGIKTAFMTATFLRDPEIRRRRAVIESPSAGHHAVAIGGYPPRIAHRYKGMRVLRAAPHEVRRREKRGLSIELATSSTDIEAAQRLRYRVFIGEMGARITGRTPGRDEDIFDPWCGHLVVRDNDTDQIVGTYRFLTADRVKRNPAR